MMGVNTETSVEKTNRRISIIGTIVVPLIVCAISVTVTWFATSDSVEQGVVRVLSNEVPRIKAEWSLERTFEEVLLINEENEEAQETIKSLEKQVEEIGKEKNVSEVINRAKTYADQEKYDLAIGALQNSLFKNDEINMLISQYIQDYLSQLRVEVTKHKNEKNIDGAKKILNASHTLLPNNETINGMIDEINSYKPVELRDLVRVDSYEYKTIKGLFKDSFGNTYNNAYSFHTSANAFAVYNLKGAYSELQAVVCAGEDTGSDAVMNMEFYIDDKLVKPIISGQTRRNPPQNITIDLQGGQILTIRTSESKGIYTTLYLAEAKVYPK
jgi:tetratricopeptide (TPR) repeat protein